MSRELEAHPRAGAGLDKEIDHRLAAQGGHFLDLARADLLKGIRCFEDEIDLVRGKFAQTK